MEVRTQAVDRLLESISPALAAELERILNETRQKLESEFAAKLQNTVRDAENAARSAADAATAQHTAELQRAVEETRQATRSQVTEEQRDQFNKTLAEALENLKTTHAKEAEKALQAWNGERVQLSTERDRLSAEVTKLRDQIEQWRLFAEANRQLTEATSQPEILVRWLKLAEPFASSVAIYTAKEDGLALWKSRGKAVFPDITSPQTADPESYFKPVMVREKTVAAVSALPPYKPEALDFLVGSVERAIEVFGLKLRTPARK